jgi:hypothetical protein
MGFQPEGRGGLMSAVSTPVQARSRLAIKDKLRDAATITKLTRENDAVTVQVAAPPGVKLAMDEVEKALEDIGQFLKTEGVNIVRVNGAHS